MLQKMQVAICKAYIRMPVSFPQISTSKYPDLSLPEC